MNQDHAKTRDGIALLGALHVGEVQGRHDITPGNKFRGAFAAADEVGLVECIDLRALRSMFISGYLNVIPKTGVTVDANCLVVGKTQLTNLPLSIAAGVALNYLEDTSRGEEYKDGLSDVIADLKTALGIDPNH